MLPSGVLSNEYRHIVRWCQILVKRDRWLNNLSTTELMLFVILAVTIQDCNKASNLSSPSHASAFSPLSTTQLKPKFVQPHKNLK